MPTERAAVLGDTAERQLNELRDLISTLDEAALRRPVPGRERLGDGTVGTLVAHTVGNYGRISAFIANDPAGHDRHLEHQLDPSTLAVQLERCELTERITELTDERLDVVPPPAGSFRFCDGNRTLEEVLAGLLKHQSHQVAALGAALASVS